ncbi:ABC transporter permease subunit [Actinomadura sp. 6K520]|uniref:ABC transporter permease subunit n=1 Tax=Actinomadura sp. 6K520 TaxID=2530364 RepID=UPI001043C1F9|nr:ABC transporter permease subunit [Actinomadura sp. 6K520]TDE34722.1 ABC transporter permease [Actinomadura sp. 6K520]
MIWLTLRQFRVQGAVVFAGLAVLGAALALTGPGLADEYATGIASCTTKDACNEFARQFVTEHQAYYGALLAIVVGLPGLLGVFWGAPLIAREIEAGTHRLAWNQSVPRTRWLAVKLGLVGSASMAAAGIAVFAVDRWSDPLAAAAATRSSRIMPLLFDAHGIAPVGYAAFAFALGVTVGVLVRRTLPAMAITLAVFAAVQVAVPLWVRPHLIPPESGTVAITSDNLDSLMLHNDSLIVRTQAEAGAWTLANHTVDASGREVEHLPASLGPGPCAPPGPRPGAKGPAGPAQECFDAFARLGYRQHVVYHPADRFWPLQWAETGLFAILTLGLTGFCFYWTRRRVS